METLRYPTPKALVEDACNAVREKDGTTDPIDHQDLPDRIRAIPSGGNDVDLSQIQTKAENVLETETYMGSDGEMHYGSMPENEDKTVTLDGDNTSHTIENGHHKGGGVVRIVPDDTGNTFVPTKNGGEYDAPAGKVYTKVILDPIPDIYVDASQANAKPAQVYSGVQFIGAAGELETGTMTPRTGNQKTVYSNGNVYLTEGYYDDSAYVKVNVSQTIVDGEDSTDCTAEAADVRKNKTFRSGGVKKTGTMPDITLPTLEVSYDTTSSDTDVVVKATLPASSAGYLEARSVSQQMKFIPKYTGSYSVTPGGSAQTLQTSGKYMTGNITVSAVPAEEATSGHGTKLVVSQTSTFTITGVTKRPNMVSLCLNADYGDDNYQVHDFFYDMNGATYNMTWTDEVQKDSSISVVVLKSERGEGNAVVTYANNTITITLNSAQFFYGTYSWIWG